MVRLNRLALRYPNGGNNAIVLGRHITTLGFSCVRKPSMSHELYNSDEHERDIVNGDDEFRVADDEEEDEEVDTGDDDEESE